MKPYLSVILVLVFGLGGCSLAPPYTTPEAPVPASWPDGPAYGDSSTRPAEMAAADIPWRGFFKEAHLQQMIAAALENNRDLRLAALNVQRARAVYGIQRSALFPSVSAAANGSKQRVPADLSSTGESRTVEQYDVNLGIFGWEIDFFGRIRSLKDQALETFLATEQAQRSAQILVVSAVADAYLSLAASRENLTLAEETLATQQQAYDLIERRFKAGLASELDLNRAGTQVEAARGDTARYLQQAARAQNALAFLIGGLPPVPIDSKPSQVTGFDPFESVSAGVSSEVLLRRPDILQAEHLFKSSPRQYRRRAGGAFSPDHADNIGGHGQQRTVRTFRVRFGNLALRARYKHAAV